MTKIKQEHIDNLRRGRKSGANIGGRRTPHHLYKYEEYKYNKALKNKYLEVTTRDRINLMNLWEKVCAVHAWKNYILMKNTEKGIADIYLGGDVIHSGALKDMKEKIQSLI